MEVFIMPALVAAIVGMLGGAVWKYFELEIFGLILFGFLIFPIGYIFWDTLTISFWMFCDIGFEILLCFWIGFLISMFLVPSKSGDY